jgi:hypothetical protein
MCTELILAAIYFATILTVNYFLYKLLSGYCKNILYLFQMSNIFEKFPKEEVRVLALLYFSSKNNFKNINSFSILNRFSDSDDILVIGKTYDYLIKSMQEKSNPNPAILYYLKLLESQFLYKNTNL